MVLSFLYTESPLKRSPRKASPKWMLPRSRHVLFDGDMIPLLSVQHNDFPLWRHCFSEVSLRTSSLVTSNYDPGVIPIVCAVSVEVAFLSWTALIWPGMWNSAQDGNKGTLNIHSSTLYVNYVLCQTNFGLWKSSFKCGKYIS